VFERVLSIEPYHLSTNNHLGRYYFMLGKLDRAEAQFRKILKAHPENGDALANLAGTLASGGAYEEAENYFRKAIATTPAKPGYYFGLAALLTRQKKFSDAASLREKGLAKDPQNARQHYYVAVDYYFSKDLRNAEKHLAIAQRLKFPGVESVFEQNLARARSLQKQSGGE
jgi:Flp pilus assembly protein TadD